MFSLSAPLLPVEVGGYESIPHWPKADFGVGVQDGSRRVAHPQIRFRREGIGRQYRLPPSRKPCESGAPTVNSRTALKAWATASLRQAPESTNS